MAKKGFLDGYKTYDTAKGFGDASQWQKAFRERMSFTEAKRIIEQQSDSPHAILGVNPLATQQEIKAAFRKLIVLWHPDRNQDNIQVAEEKSKKIIAAYTILTK